MKDLEKAMRRLWKKVRKECSKIQGMYDELVERGR